MEEGVHATLECEKHSKFDGGDHAIFVGRPVAITTDEDAESGQLI
jgi:flavin reductase (DIM6/NTAB) family NADH-FMN oxidoreductase RutF